LKKAEKMLHIALRLAQQQQDADGITYVYDLLANLALEKGEFNKSEKLFVSVMQRLLGSGVAQDDSKIIHISLKLAEIYALQAEKPEFHTKAKEGFR
jgi:tetratricopeptide repeat protein 19